MAVLRPRWATGPPRLQTDTDTETNSILLVSWWCTIFSLTVIVIRLLGRFVRTERLFREDKVMSLAVIPLLARMAFVHVVLIWGTNNAVTTGLSDLELYHRRVGSQLVLPARILYAAYIWTAKMTVVEFVRRALGPSWTQSYELAVRLIYGFLAFTWVAVVVTTLAECQPFAHYWQVVPDPGPHCRTGFSQLVTMGVCDVLTDVVLVVFPIPLILRSRMPVARKVSLSSLFLLSTILIGITCYRVPSTIARRESQPYRSLLASVEILAATGVANAVVIGSFVRDRGVKKAKFKAESVEDGNSLMRSVTHTRSLTHHHWGSDEDLVRDLGLALQPDLRHRGGTPKPAPVAQPPIGAPMARADAPRLRADTAARPSGRPSRTARRRGSLDSTSASSRSSRPTRPEWSRYTDEPSPGTRGHEPPMGFFDVGQLVDTSSHSHGQSLDSARSLTGPGADLFISDVGGLLGPSSSSSSSSPAPPGDPAPPPPPPPHEPAAYGVSPSSGPGDDLRSFLRSASPFRHDHAAGRSSRRRSRPASQSPLPRAPGAAGPDDLNISDAGGLLR